MLRSLKKSEAGRSLSGGSNHPHILGQPHPGACLTAEAAEILKKPVALDVMHTNLKGQLVKDLEIRKYNL